MNSIMRRPLSIRTLLLVTVSVLTLFIVGLAARQLYAEWLQLTKIRSLEQASLVGDMLFQAVEDLSMERDIAYSMLYARDSATMDNLKPQLEEIRRVVDADFSRAFAMLEKYPFPELLELRGKISARFSSIRALRARIGVATGQASDMRDNTLAEEWLSAVKAQMQQTESAWTAFIKHFANIDPMVTQHLRFKKLLRLITDYNSRERFIIGRMIVDNVDPLPEELAQLLRNQGALDASWDLSFVLVDQSGLYPSIAPFYTDAKSHYDTLQEIVGGLFSATALRRGGYPISVEMWLELSSQAAESLQALKNASYTEMMRYIQDMAAESKRAIALHSLMLLFSLLLCWVSFRVVNRRVIRPIHEIVDAMLRVMRGEEVAFIRPVGGLEDEIGKLAQVLAVFQKSTDEVRRTALELERSENRLRAVVDNALDGLISIDARGCIENFNPACERIFGYKTDEVIGRNIKILMPEPYHSAHDGYLKHYAATGEARIIGTAGREVKAQRKDGSVFPMDLSISAFRLEDGQHYSGIVRDITARKEAEANVQRYMQALEHSNKELDDFAYIASHDLKEPLRGIHNHSRFLLEDNEEKLDAESVSRLHRLIYLTQRMERLVNDLLYFSRLGRQEIAIQPADMNAVIHDIETTLELFLGENNAHILLPKALPVFVCDKTRVTELFRNLITNAVKYNDNKEKTVEIGFLESQAAPNGIMRDVFYVRDNGQGIEPQFHDEIFRIFKRLQSSKGKQEEGTGVGLTFVKKIVERHGGTIWLDSAPGEGTTFYFTLEENGYGKKNAA